MGHRWTDFDKAKYGSLLEAIASRNSCLFNSMAVGRLMVREDKYISLFPQKINHMMPLLVLSGAVEEESWQLTSHGSRRNIIYRRLFSGGEIEKYLNRMCSISDERKQKKKED